MFSIIRGKNLKQLVTNIQQLVGIRLNRTESQITDELEQISNLIRKNIERGQLWHTNTLKTDLNMEDTKYYAAVYASIFMEEMLYCRKTIDFIQFISHKYFEEEVLDKRHLEDEIETSEDVADTLPMTKHDIPHSSTKLAEDLFVGANLMNRSFIEFIGKLGCPFSQQTIISKHLQVGCGIALFERFCISIVDTCSDKPSATHGQFIGDFTELFKINQQAWRMMSIFAFSNLFRFIEGSSYVTNPISADDSIFANRGTPLKFDGDQSPTPMFKLANI
jgi:hypothetical protein